MTDFDRVVLPGQEGKITMTIDTKHLRGETLKSARVEWAKPAVPPTLLELAVRIRQPIEIQPSYLLLEGFPGQRSSTAVSITNHEDPPLRIGKAEVDRSEVQTQLEEIEPGRKFRLTVTRTQVLPAGAYRGKVELALQNSSLPNLQIPLTIVIKGKVNVSRGAIVFRPNRNGSEPGNPTVTVLVDKYKDPDFRVTRVHCDLPYVHAEIVAGPYRADVATYELRFTLRRAAGPPAPFHGSVTLETNDAEFPRIALPVMGPGRNAVVRQISFQGGQQ